MTVPQRRSIITTNETNPECPGTLQCCRSSNNKNRDFESGHERGPPEGHGPNMEAAFLGRRAPIFVVELTTKVGCWAALTEPPPKPRVASVAAFRLAARQSSGTATSFYSITSSARASSDWGTSRRRALAVLRLMYNSSRVGCSIGISAGLVPLKILSTTSAALRYISERRAP